MEFKTVVPRKGRYALDGIRSVNGLRVIGMPRDRDGVISLVMNGIPDQEIGKMLDALVETLCKIRLRRQQGRWLRALGGV